MRKFLIPLIIIIITVFVSAQENQYNNKRGNLPAGPVIRGKVIDSQSKEPINYANVTLFNPKDSTVVNGAVSNESGIFLIKGISPGKYYAKVSFIGYKTNLIKEINIQPKKLFTDLGTISLVASSVKMKEVVVKGDKDMVVTNLDKQVINVEKDLNSSTGGTALDVMQNIPSLTVDINGNISLRGNPNVTILIDGKPSGLAGLNSSDVLTAIPATSIKSIELVTNPSAKYDPDGTAGIINIVLKKKTDLGFNGILNLNAGTGSKYMGSANFNYRTGDLNFFGDFAGRMFQFNNTLITNRTNFFGNSIPYINQNSSGANNFDMSNINLGTDYLLDDYNTMTFNIQLRQFHSDNSGYTNNYELNDQLNQTDFFKNINTGDRNVNSFTYTLSYKKDYDEKEKSLTADAIYTHNTMFSNSGTTRNSFEIEDSNGTFPPSLINNTYNNFNNMLILQSNYVQPFGEKNRIEAGFKSQIRELGIDYNFYDFDSNTDSWVNNFSRSNNFDYKEQIHAIYGIYTGAAGDFKYQGGVRGEDAIINSNLTNTNVSFYKHYYNLYPSAYIAYDFTPLQELKASYSRRVDRPSPWQLNPFINYSDSLNLTYGNPNLLPQYTNSYELGYSTIFFDFDVNANLFYKQTNGLINQVSTLVKNGITETTYENISNENNYGTELIVNGSLFPWWRINANASYFRADISDAVYVTNVNNSTYSWTGRVNSIWFFSPTLVLQISSTYNSPAVRAQGKTDAVYFTDVAMKKDLMNKNLSISLRLSDIFNTRKYGSQIYGDGFTSYNTGQRDSRILFLGITYNLNSYKQPTDRDKLKDINMNEEMDSQ